MTIKGKPDTKTEIGFSNEAQAYFLLSLNEVSNKIERKILSLSF